MKAFGSSFYVVAIFLMSILTGCHNQQKSYFFEAGQIKDHPTPEQVIKIMQTEPDTAFNRLFYGKLRYIQLYNSQDSTEFRFKDGRLMEVIIHKPVMNYRPESIENFGLVYKKPAEWDTSAFFRWKKQYEGFDDINFYKVGSRKNNRKVNYKIFFRLSK